MEQREYIVEAEGAGQRIDRFLSGEDTGLSRSALQGLVAESHVLCNGRAPAKSLKLKAGDIILLEIPDAKPIEAVPQEIPLDIIYEDAHLLVVNKPKGMVVHPAPGNPDGTLVNALLWHCKGSLSGIGGEIRPGIVHRIDKDTSGLLVVAKDDATHIGLSQRDGRYLLDVVVNWQARRWNPPAPRSEWIGFDAYQRWELIRALSHDGRLMIARYIVDELRPMPGSKPL